MVIGIIALLIGILLPALDRVRQQARLVQCQAQLRSNLQTLLLYAAENSGSMPYGFAWQRMNVNPITGRPTGQWDTRMSATFWEGRLNGYYRATSWQVVVNSLQLKLKDGFLWPNDTFFQDKSVLNNRVRIGPSMTCPEVAGDSRLSIKGPFVTYGANSLILVNQSYEIAPQEPSWWRFGFDPSTKWPPANATDTDPMKKGTTFSIAPAKLGQLYPDNAILWDTAIMSEALTGPRWLWDVNSWGGMSVSAIDNGRLLQPQLRHLRYRNQQQKPYNRPEQNIDRPIYYPARSTNFKQWIGSGSYVANGDFFYSDTDPNTYVPLEVLNIPRFRHMRDTIANVAFADGSVRAVRWFPNRVTMSAVTNRPMAANEFIRSWLMIRRPAALPSPQVDQ